MELSHCIDWLQYSVPIPEGADPVSVIRASVPQHQSTQLTGEHGDNIQGYDTCLRLGVGRAHYHTKHPENKVSLQWSGNEMHNTAAEGLSAHEMIARSQVVGGKITRIDFAVDIRNSEAELSEVLEELNNGGGETMAQSWGAYLGFKKVAGKVYPSGTIYIGATTSQRMVRVYDKGAQLGNGENWKRIELVSRQDAGQSIGVAMVSNDIGATGRTALRFFYRSKLTWFESACLSDAIYIAPISERETNTVDWLLGAVLQTLDKELAIERKNGKKALYSAFNALLHKHRKLIADR